MNYILTVSVLLLIAALLVFAYAAWQSTWYVTQTGAVADRLGMFPDVIELQCKCCGCDWCRCEVDG